jgi:hypothetical protein
MESCPRSDRVSRSSADCHLCTSRLRCHSHCVGFSGDTLVYWIDVSVNGFAHNQTSPISRCNGRLIQRSWHQIASTLAKFSIASGPTALRSKSSAPTALVEASSWPYAWNRLDEETSGWPANWKVPVPGGSPPVSPPLGNPGCA